MGKKREPGLGREKPKRREKGSIPKVPGPVQTK